MRVDDKLCARASTATCVVSKEQVARQPSTELAGEPSRGAAKPFVSRRRLGTATRRRHAGVRAQVESATRHKAVRVVRLSVRRPPAERHQRDETHSAPSSAPNSEGDACCAADETRRQRGSLPKAVGRVESNKRPRGALWWRGALHNIELGATEHVASRTASLRALKRVTPAMRCV